MCNFFRTADGRAVDKVRGKQYTDYRQGWYYREFVTPAECANRQTLLKFDALYSRGLLFVNGKAVPLPGHTPKLSMNSPAFLVDITDCLRPAGKRIPSALQLPRTTRGEGISPVPDCRTTSGSAPARS